MNQAHKISLISKVYTTNEIGVPVATETKKAVYAIKFSIGQSEFYKAGQQGLKPMACFAVRASEYSGQEELEADGERLTIYRTYQRTDGRTELYVKRRKGVNDTVTT